MKKFASILIYLLCITSCAQKKNLVSYNKDYKTDVSDHVEEILNNKFKQLEPGYYYITRPIEIRTSKVNDLRNVYIYTNKNINIFNIYVGRVYFEYGEIDVTQVENPSKRVFNYIYRDNLQLFNGIHKTYVKGNEKETFKEGMGYDVVFFDSTTRDQKGTHQDNGEAHYFDINLITSFARNGIILSSNAPYNQNRRPSGVHQLRLISAGNKRAMILDGIGGGSNIFGYHQSRQILQESEKDFPLRDCIIFN